MSGRENKEETLNFHPSSHQNPSIIRLQLRQRRRKQWGRFLLEIDDHQVISGGRKLNNGNLVISVSGGTKSTNKYVENECFYFLHI